MTDGRELAARLLAYARAHLHTEAADEIYMQNVLLETFGCTEPWDGEIDRAAIEAMDVPDALAEAVRTYALEAGLCDEATADRFVTDVFGLLTPLPSVVNATFRAIRERDGESAACDYLYDLCVKNGYIRKTAIAQNLKWGYEDGSRRLEITVNLSKPEKNNKDIAKLLTAPVARKYPACLLCRENEGFAGTATHPARRNIRTIRMTIGGEPWFMQYSPYAYYDEHCIVINNRHTPMRVDASTPAKLLDFVDQLPNYFIGSNASLPIVGGSILNHEHYQGGLHLMPMHYAPIGQVWSSPDFPTLRIGILDWYNSAVQCEGADRAAVEAFACRLIETWRNYDDPTCEILSHTGETPHNTVSPIVRKTEQGYIFTMILRNNRTNEQYPNGIFHVHPEYENIKSEGIGLIEAMGLFILPPRLKRQFAAIEELLTGATPYDAAAIASPSHDLYLHREMIRTLMADGGAESREAATARVRAYVNRVCAGILENTAVFKHDARGAAGFTKFMQTMGLKEGERQ